MTDPIEEAKRLSNLIRSWSTEELSILYLLLPELVERVEQAEREMGRASSLGHNVVAWARAHHRSVTEADIKAIVGVLDSALAAQQREEED